MEILLESPFCLPPPTPGYMISHSSQAPLPAHQSCPCALIKSLFRTKDVTRIRSWSLALDLTYTPKVHHMDLEIQLLGPVFHNHCQGSLTSTLALGTLEMGHMCFVYLPFSLSVTVLDMY